MEMRSGDVFFAGMLVSMHKPRASNRKIKSAEGLPKNMRSDSVLFGRLPLALFGSIGLSIIVTVEVFTRAQTATSQFFDAFPSYSL